MNLFIKITTSVLFALQIFLLLSIFVGVVEFVESNESIGTTLGHFYKDFKEASK